MKNTLLTIVSVSFSGFLVYLFDKLFGNLIPWDNFWPWMGATLSKTVTVGQLILFSCLFLSLFILGRLKFNGNGLTKRQKRFIKTHKSLLLGETNVEATFYIYFDHYGEPKVDNVQLYCLNHGTTPLRFRDGSCQAPPCKNNERKVFGWHVADAIESVLVKEWSSFA